MSEEEKIKKAEEISARRNNRIPVSNINTTRKKKLSLLSKIFIQVICSICIFGIFYFMNQNNSLAIEKIKPIFSEDTDFVQIYNQIDAFIKNMSNSFNNEEEKNNVENANQESNETNNSENEEDKNGSNENQNEQVNEDTSQENQNKNNNEISEENQNGSNDGTSEQNQNVGIGGGDESVAESETDQDVLYIKANANFIKPVNGYITSAYGEREATEIISANHAGVDIGANSGTEIVASMSGTVELVSNYGDYGNHLKITNGEITTLYAHCSSILVKQGDYINQGQRIATVGTTGRTTGPHLHFEIRRNNKTVDPQKILEL